MVFFVLLFFLIKFHFDKFFQEYTIRVSNSLNPDQEQRLVGLDRGLGCMQRLSADDTSGQRVLTPEQSCLLLR